MKVAHLAIVAALLAGLPAVGSAQDQDGSRDGVRNLEAYAVYKMGRYDEAKKIWEELAAKGNTTAIINLANMFEQGQGVTEDRKQAFTFRLQAAELGDARAQHEVGLAYEKGTLVPRDIDKAGHWLMKSADQGYADGQFAYGVLLATGRGKGIKEASQADRAEARSWLEKAKVNGNLEAGEYLSILARPSSP